MTRMDGLHLTCKNKGLAFSALRFAMLRKNLVHVFASSPPLGGEGLEGKTCVDTYGSIPAPLLVNRTVFHAQTTKAIHRSYAQQTHACMDSRAYIPDADNNLLHRELDDP